MIAKLGVAALIVALIAIFVPAVAILVSLAALVLAILAGLAGDRWFTTATPLVVAVNTFLLSPTTQFYAGHMAASERTLYLVLFCVLLAAPYVAIALNRAGIVAIRR